MKVYVILYTYNGYDGSVNELMADNDGKFVGYSSRELAEQNKPKSDKYQIWTVEEVEIK